MLSIVMGIQTGRFVCLPSSEVDATVGKIHSDPENKPNDETNMNCIMGVHALCLEEVQQEIHKINQDYRDIRDKIINLALLMLGVRCFSN